MIVVTRLNDSQFAVNPDLIERIHANPDTTLVMVDGAKYIVTESVSEVIHRIAAFRAYVLTLARDLPPTVLQHPAMNSDAEPARTADGGHPADGEYPNNTVPLYPRT